MPYFGQDEQTAKMRYRQKTLSATHDAIASWKVLNIQSYQFEPSQNKNKTLVTILISPYINIAEVREIAMNKKQQHIIN